MGAEKVESEVMRKVLSRVLDPPYVIGLLEEVNSRLEKGPEDLDLEITRTERALMEANRAVEALLDLAEEQGPVAAAHRGSHIRPKSHDGSGKIPADGDDR